jgi:hypothetical protein
VLCIDDEDENPIVDIQSIEVYPDPPAPGKDLTVKVKAETSETIEVCLRLCLYSGR